MLVVVQAFRLQVPLLPFGFGLATVLRGLKPWLRNQPFTTSLQLARLRTYMLLKLSCSGWQLVIFYPPCNPKP